MPWPRFATAQTTGAALVLDAIGLDDEHTSVYRLLLAAPSADIGEIARGAAMPVARVQAVVDELERIGLLARQASAPDRVVASPPALALRPLLLERERRLTEAHETLVQLSELYRQGAVQREVPDVVDVVLGPEAVRQRLGQLQASAERRVDAFVLREVALIDGSENTEEDRALARGVRYRVVVEASVLERPKFLDQAREVMPLGEEIRVLPTLPTRLFIADGILALLPMYSHGDRKVSGALLVHPSGLLDLVNAMFEEYWRTSTRLVEDGGLASEVEAIDRDLLKLLLLGMTDAAAGAQLGISVRTVQRRVAELMDRGGVTTRIQLGAEAVRREWV
ncbi:sugar-specific transcriptional regulator TrmB/DNA-binding CsgD family transcriptional regulator [Agromyces sp. 3263]|uniref:helix-turn-helix domain-containing protein n=1 Tax=Agromyces sp. 3263 TaxID=2817750 RepID=UPI00285F631F|nr:helix-turn-helix domain-containing protein [Agromyces sp. 3263]MDR6906465.1 sugar-specific transcriptional regulator TrmB/DNA-binding CsgD family transcriptional regulator [Agromyces sp. 3263]